LFIKLASWEFVMLHNVLVMNWPTGKLAWWFSDPSLRGLSPFEGLAVMRAALVSPGSY
jgi:hypothetical protein